MAQWIRFPEGFLWGATTSAYQIEGAWDVDGKSESIWDRFTHTPGKIYRGDTGDAACNHYHRYPEDVALMKTIGLKAYCFSVAWTRILPEGYGRVNQAGLDFYRRLVDTLLEAGIQPFVMLYHWDLPQCLEDQGGWPTRSVALAFIEYADVVSRSLGDRVKYWVTHNEPAVVSWLGYYTGEHAPGRKDLTAAIRASHHLLLSHGWVVPVIRRNSPSCEVGIILNVNWIVPASQSPYDRELASQVDGMWVRWFFDPLRGRGYPDDMVSCWTSTGVLPRGLDFVRPGDMEAICTPCDFFGVNYYTRTIVRADVSDNDPPVVLPAPEGPDYWSEMGWENCPDGLLAVLSRLSFHYHLPKLYITENGVSYSDGPDERGVIQDYRRIRYLQEHLVALHRALGLGIPVKGYFVWSLLDNFEWAWGYSQRFGLVWVDYATQKRLLKGSAYWYSQVIRDNGFAL